MSGGGVYSAKAGGGLSLTAGAFSMVNAISAFRLTSDTPGVVGTASTGVILALAANTNYAFEAHLLVDDTNGTLTNYQIHALAAAASLVFVRGVWEDNALTGAATKGAVVTAVTTNILPGTAAGSIMSVDFYGLVTVGANATTLQIDAVATGTTDKVAKSGSWIRAMTVA